MEGALPWEGAFFEGGDAGGFDPEAKGHAGNVGGALKAAGSGVHEQKAFTTVPEDLRDVGVAADEYVRMEGVDEGFRTQVVDRAVRIVGPVAAGTETDVGHQDPQPLALETLEGRIVLSHVLAIAVAVDSDKGLERGDVTGALESAEIARVPDAVHGREEVPHIVGEHAMRVRNQTDEHL